MPAELLVYTRQEWRQMQAEGERFARALSREVVWIYPDAAEGPRSATNDERR